jgi:tetratricopeptide (TPR) repeat protein
MSVRKKPQVQVKAASPAIASGSPWWFWPALVSGALVLAFGAYGPVLNGPFVFDDLNLPFAIPDHPSSLSGYLGPIRPLLMTSYWLNFRTSGVDPTGYHVTSLFIHVIAALLIFPVLTGLLERAGIEKGRRDPLGIIGVLIFLLHPVQTEAVAYVAGRSECLSVMFLLSAYAVFVKRGDEISWGRAIAVLALFAAAAMSKEHTVVLVPLLLLTDLWFSPGPWLQGIRRNWRLYSLMGAGGAISLAFVWRLVSQAGTVGFGMQDVTWYQYLFTQFRALWTYLRIFVLPYGLNADYDFPFSNTILDHGAILGLIGLLVVTAAAWRYRREYRLASFGWFAFLIVMAPTSSIVPIRDPLADRRLYLGMIGLLPIVLEVLLRLKLKRGALIALIAAIGVTGLALTYSRATVWASPFGLWQDTVAKAPQKARPRFQLAKLWFDEGRCDIAATEFAATAKLQKPAYDLLVDWGLALDCIGQPDAALAKFREAAVLEPSAHIYSQIGMVYARQSRWKEAMEAVDRSLQIDPKYTVSLIYKGNILLANNNPAGASEACLSALAVNSGDPQARKCYDMAQAQLRGQK